MKYMILVLCLTRGSIEKVWYSALSTICVITVSRYICGGTVLKLTFEMLFYKIKLNQFWCISVNKGRGSAMLFIFQKLLGNDKNNATALLKLIILKQKKTLRWLRRQT